MKTSVCPHQRKDVLRVTERSGNVQHKLRREIRKRHNQKNVKEALLSLPKEDNGLYGVGKDTMHDKVLSPIRCPL